MNSNSVYQDFLLALAHKEPSRPPVCVWNTRSNLVKARGATKLLDYYQNVEVKLYSQLFPLDAFEDCLIIPGVWPDYGVALEASAFGSPVHWEDNNPPLARPCFQSMADFKKHFKKRKAVNPNEDGLMPKALEEYRYMLKNLEKKYVQKAGYLDGCALITGPLEVATTLVGHANLYLTLYDDPQLVHDFLAYINDGIIKYVKKLESISGEIKLLSMIEHNPGQITPQQFQEFAVPYISQIFSEFPKAVKVYHNEDNVTHVLAGIPKLKADVWHFGDVDLEQTKTVIGDKITLMGNLHPLRVLLEGTPAEVEAAARDCIAKLAPGGGFILCSGGGLAPGTPLENVATMVKAARWAGPRIKIQE
jgi:uroporphyrinogen decarboxylase